MGGSVKVLAEGNGELVGWHDPDENREWIREHKSRALTDKRMSLREAISRFVGDGNVIAFGGFGHIRVSMAAIYEIIRQRRRDLLMVAKTGAHDSDLLICAGCVTLIEVSYAFGHEMRGLSPGSRRAVESGRCKVVAEMTNAAHQWRFLAAMMGVPFMPTRNLLGTDTFKHSSAKVAEDPFSGKLLCLVPAIYPDVAIIHVPRCDQYGNSQIDGPVVQDFELSRAARRIIVTAEEIVSEDLIRDVPYRTVIPFYVVDAVVEVPYGCHPCEMPYLYFFDEEHIAEWLDLSKSDEGVQEYLNRYIYGVTDFEDYLDLVGGTRKMNHLQRVETYQEPVQAPWLEKKSTAKGAG